MKRRFILPITVLLTCALLLSACGGSAEAEPTPTPTAEPTAAPTDTPAPTEAPTPTPTEAPTPTPTAEPTETPEPTEEPTPSPTPAPPVACGIYTYRSPEGEWKLELRDDGLFTITDPDGGIHTGEGWSTAADGTVHCGPTDIYFSSFAYDGGCSRWSISGSTCSPLPRK